MQSKVRCVRRGTLQSYASPGSLGTAVKGHGRLQCVGIAGTIPVLGLWDVAGDRACWQSQPGAGFFGAGVLVLLPVRLRQCRPFKDSSLGWIKPCMVVALLHFKTVLIYIWIPMGHLG